MSLCISTLFSVFTLKLILGSNGTNTILGFWENDGNSVKMLYFGCKCCIVKELIGGSKWHSGQGVSHRNFGLILIVHEFTCEEKERK